MSGADRGHAQGVVLLCDLEGNVREVLRDDPGTAGGASGRPFTSLVGTDSRIRALSLLVALRTEGSTSGWLLDMASRNGPLSLEFGGVATSSTLLLVGGTPDGGFDQLFHELVERDDPRLDALRGGLLPRASESGEQEAGGANLLAELSRLNQELVAVQRELSRKNEELQRMYVEVQRLAVTDPLTGAFNRRGFFELAGRELDRASRFQHPLSAIMLDIDRFKRVNDTHGHAVGDQVLAATAARLRAELRKIDILGRYGGEEFAIILPETAGENAREVGERLRRSVEQSTIAYGATRLGVTISLGIVSLGTERLTVEELLARADQALYAAKQSGRNRLCVWQERG
jgi:diguanylate cyclase (GGDEF)-like protein